MSEVWNKVYKSDNTFFGEEAKEYASTLLVIILKYTFW
jgi:hypothetical protein